MPHITLDYSPNMEDRTDIAALCRHLRQAAAATGVFPLAGIRVRAFAANHVSIADGDDRHGYVDISVRLRAGRDLDTRKRAAQAVFDAARAFLEPALQQHSIALSLEMRDIDPELSPKCGTIRDHMQKADPS
ncbi:5-carboxymethyl-2-hydroxymuconate Delta-isomerase [Leisingera caerulea]|uniref:5-carboxymethyl-2-hydroxymuconate Delta-isomerase n=1 Tax=Leisingera caerulea TaxID=506591 RepID=A0A9Q9HJY9_LEICA|nr:5-carboxymethyl-2-hydroxymuconate Delta-isomerase [Leisingera caerulea]UWQ53532.1 5-carboxymethyl-2-hydroxymuconate Delta-isomerase [Leisingera caerulea]UWQ62296.1 5-carboxymethyl-2-hydroxymuconate Delta-isomerase [Leisingera caerulea]